MTTFTGTQKNRAQHNTSASGNAWHDNNKVAAIAGPLLTTDKVVGLEVPAGVELSTLRWYGGDFETDASPTLTMNIGYRSKLPGGSLVANPTYFASASTAFRAATTAWQELVFTPIKFDEPVEITFIPQAAATAQSAAVDLNVQGGGRVVGIA